MSIEVKEDTVLGIHSFIWKRACVRSNSHCKRAIGNFPDEALCLLHNMNSNIAVEVLRGSPAYLLRQRT